MSTYADLTKIGLVQAAEARRVALVDARDAYDRAVTRAAADAAVAIRHAEFAWATAHDNAVAAAKMRRDLWRVHQAMETPELVTVLHRHEFKLGKYSTRGYMERKLSVWYVRMIRSELTRRGEI
jgi:hypothetical protein